MEKDGYSIWIHDEKFVLMSICDFFLRFRVKKIYLWRFGCPYSIEYASILSISETTTLALGMRPLGCFENFDLFSNSN